MGEQRKTGSSQQKPHSADNICFTLGSRRLVPQSWAPIRVTRLQAWLQLQGLWAGRWNLSWGMVKHKIPHLYKTAGDVTLHHPSPTL